MTVHDTDFGVVEALEWGDGDELVVLLHALAAGPRSLVPLAERLYRPGRRILVPALHGYGATRVSDAADPVDAHLAVARWALDGGGSGRKLLFGHSMGGLAALLAAAGRDDLAGLVLYEPIVHAALDHGDRELAAAERTMIRGIREAIERGEPEAGLGAFIEMWNETRWTDLPAKLRLGLLADAGRLAAEAEAVAGRAVPASLWTTVATASTVLHGDRSPPLAARMAERLAARLPAARAQTLPGLGHMAPAVAPDAIAAALQGAAAGHCIDGP